MSDKWSGLGNERNMGNYSFPTSHMLATTEHWTNPASIVNDTESNITV